MPKLPPLEDFARHSPGTPGTGFSGAPDTIRTCDLRLTRAPRSPTEPFWPNPAQAGRCRSRADRLNEPHAPVAQLDRALPSEGKGHTFESCRVRQFVLGPFRTHGSPFSQEGHTHYCRQMPSILRFQSDPSAVRRAAGAYAADLRPRVRGGAISSSAGLFHSRCSFRAIRIVRGRFLVRMSDARCREPSSPARSAWV
jgi:hypothetical protein